MPRHGLAAFALLAGLFAEPANALDGLQPGMKAPSLLLETLEGQRVAFSDFGDARAFLLVFWAGWSAKSPEVVERVEKLHVSLRRAGLVVLGINVESPALGAEEVRSVRLTVSRLGLTFPILLDRGLNVFGAYGVVAVPSSVLVGADGTVLAALAAYPIAGREEFFDLVEATVSGRQPSRRPEPQGPQPNARAVRYFNLGRTLMLRGLTEEAAGHLRRAIEADPAFLLPRVRLGQLLRERAVAREAIEIGGRTVMTVHIEAAEREKLLREAETLLVDAIRLDPQDPGALTELALVHVARSDTAKARELLERALRLNADYPPARSHLGALLLTAGDAVRGRAELSAAIQLNPLDWRLHITAAQAYVAKGLLQPALEAYRRGVDLLWQARLERDQDAPER